MNLRLGDCLEVLRELEANSLIHEDCRALGIEIDPEYHRMASHRIDKATAQLRLSL
jgi:DNA modification methylase